MAVSKRRSILIIVIPAGILCAFLLWVALSQQRLTVYDPTDYGPYGLKAVGLLLQKEGFTMREINTIPQNISEIMVMNTSNQLTPSVRRNIFQWVGSGGVLIELAQSKPVINPTKLVETPKLRSVKTQVSVSPLVRFKDLKYYFKKDMFYTTVKPDQGFYAIDHRFFIYMTEYGAGRIIHWNDPDGITNIHVRNHPDNAVIFVMLVKMFHQTNRIGFYNLAGQTTAPLDEFNWGELFDRYWEAGFILLTGIFLLLWRLGSRFGRPRPLTLAKGRSADEFVYALANLLQQANAKTVVLDNLCNALRDMIIKITGLPKDAGIPVMVARLNEITGKDYREMGLLFEKAQNRGISKHQFIDIAKALNTYRRELAEWIESTK